MSCTRTSFLWTAEDTCTSMATARNIVFQEFLNEFAADDDSDFQIEGFDLDNLAVENSVQNLENYLDMDIWTAGDREPQLLAFKITAGLKSVINNKESPLEYFNLFLCDKDFEFLAQQTNNYAHQISSAHLKPHSRFNKCQETNSTEIKIHLSYPTDGTGTSVGYQRILEYRDCYPIIPKCLA